MFRKILGAIGPVKQNWGLGRFPRWREFLLAKRDDIFQLAKFSHGM